MENQNKDKINLRYEELFARRKRLASLRNKIIESRSRKKEKELNEAYGSHEQPSYSQSVPTTERFASEYCIREDGSYEQPSYSQSVPTTESFASEYGIGEDHTNNDSSETALQDNKINDDKAIFYTDDSDDSVKDKNYVPDENSSSRSHFSASSDSSITKRRKVQAKRRLFCSVNSYNIPAIEINSTDHNLGMVNQNSPQNHIDKQNELDLITPSDLFGTEYTENAEHNHFCNCNKCIDSPPNKKICVENALVHIDEIGFLSDDDNSYPSFLPCSQYNNSEYIVTRPNSDDVTSDKTATDSVSTNNQLAYEVTSIHGNNTIVQVSDVTIPNNMMEDITGMTHIAKKKVSNPNKWRRAVAKLSRLKGSPYHSTVAKKNRDVAGRALKPPCTCKSKCYEKFSQETRQIIFNQFWKNTLNWDQRRQYIVNNVEKNYKTLMKTTGSLETDKRKFTYTYKLINDSGTHKVCKVMFLNTLSIGEKFLKVSLDKKLVGGLTGPDLRGKHVPANKSSEAVVQSIVEHINSYPASESHYTRQKSGRKFLGPDLSIALMYRHYKEHIIMENKGIPADLVAKDWIYRNIFNTKFNLSFKLPSADTCDECDAYIRKLQDCKTDTETQEVEKEKESHHKAPQERYNLKRIDKEEAIASLGKKKVLMFDLQKCLATPNLTNSQSFYLRKLWTLNLTIFDASGNVAINVLWSENISGRGGNEIASSLVRWADENHGKIASVEELTLWSDNCAGQNRNLMVVMAYIWILHKLPQLQTINHKFMLKGHTHMEVDTIHSQIEKRKKQLKNMQIAIPRDWSQFIKTCGGRRTYEVYDMELKHFKDFTTLYTKKGPFVSRKRNKDGADFKISECVWLQLNKDKPGVLSYKTDFSQDFMEISLLRNGPKDIKYPDDLPQLRQSEKPISTAKYADLMTLCKWIPAEYHDFYKNLKHCNTENDFPAGD